MTPGNAVNDRLKQGAAILAPVLQPHGFVFELEHSGKSSGGQFASGAYARGDRRLEFHFRHSLGMVRYHIGDEFLDHEVYMQLMNVRDRSRYPDFPKEPMDSFRSLAADIEAYCGDFTSGDARQFHALVAISKQNADMFKGVP